MSGVRPSSGSRCHQARFPAQTAVGVRELVVIFIEVKLLSEIGLIFRRWFTGGAGPNITINHLLNGWF
jgi:hypothetical protein